MSQEDTEKAPQPEKVVLYDPTITKLMYLCHWCGCWGEKTTWGPGWITCPHCKRRAPTAEELRHMNETFIDAR